MVKRINLLLISFILLISINFIAASVDCGANPQLTLTYDEENIPTDEVGLRSCNGSADIITITGSGLNYISLGSDSGVLTGKKTINILINQNIPIGDYLLSVNFFYNSSMILSFPVLVKINKTIQEDPTGCHLNPTLIAYSQTVQQGTQFELPKISFNPKNCQGSFSINTPYISGGITTAEGQKPVYIKSSSSNEIILGVDTSGLSSAPYKSTLTLSAFGETFTDVSTINIIVTGGTNPDTDFDVSNLPTCSITNNILNKNQTYSMVCTGITPGVTIYPIVDTDYIRGIGPGDDMTSTNFVWEFEPIKLGNTNIKAEFRYLDLPVGEPFLQEVKIQSSSSSVAGTNLKLLFTPSLNSLNTGEQTIIQLIDNKTDSLVDSPEIYLDGIKINPLNNSDKSFPLIIDEGKNYEIRGKAPGYNDLVEIINITNRPITLTLIPDKSTYTAGEKINITSNVNATIIVNDVIMSGEEYIFQNSGNYTIQGVREGYKSVEKNVSVTSAVLFISSSCSVEPEKWRDGKEVVCSLNQEANWKVYMNETLISEGTSNTVKFDVEGDGILEIKSNDVGIWSQTIGNKDWFDWGSIKEGWYYWVGGVVLFGFLVWRLGIKGRETGGDDSLVFSPAQGG